MMGTGEGAWSNPAVDCRSERLDEIGMIGREHQSALARAAQKVLSPALAATVAVFDRGLEGHRLTRNGQRAHARERIELEPSPIQ
ncbi:hypothetical protein WG901_22300 [Novosphingobium sp. PS1R-30]|uniref:Uncharacterized protein n=1 Tax=Novosphingobium anseongense TaxID=3133436 RepID=A0ABU8S368_9SPHN